MGNSNTQHRRGRLHYDTPQIATSDNGVIGASGTTYDQNGNVDGQIGAPRTLSWNENFYTDPLVNQIASTFIDLAQSFEDLLGGNPSNNDTSVEWFGIGTLLLRNLSGTTGVPGTCAKKGGIEFRLRLYFFLPFISLSSRRPIGIVRHWYQRTGSLHQIKGGVPSPSAQPARFGPTENVGQFLLVVGSS